MKGQMKVKIYLAVTIFNGKATVHQISEKYFNDFNWRLKPVRSRNRSILQKQK